MTQKHGKLVFSIALIFLFLAGGLFGAAQEENKEKKKEPFKYFDTSTSANTYDEAKDKEKKKKEPTKNNETSTTTAIVKPEGYLSNVVDDGMDIPTIEVKYINGKPHGKVLERYKNGFRIEGEYSNGLKTGLWISYDPKGKKFKQESYKDGKKYGKSIRWDEGGYVNETDYKNGLIDGKQCCWDKNGKLISEYGYKDGKAHGRHISWYPNGNKSEEGYFNEGTGEKSTWYPNGKIAIKVEFKNGKKYGKEIWWYENGRKKREQTYNEEGKKIGRFTHWYEDGKVAYEMEFDQNGQRLYKKDYEKNGNLILENDRPVDKNKTQKSYVDIPHYFDLRNEGKVTEVKDQEQGNWSNTCWAFGYIGALESRLMPPVIPFPEPDYSEQQLADKNHGWDINGLTTGGTFAMALAYLTRGGGPINETTVPYDPSHALGRQTSFPAKKWIREVQRGQNNEMWLGAKEFCQEHIYTLSLETPPKNGGVAGQMYIDQEQFNYAGSNYYWYGMFLPYNHVVVLVGWDEDYSRFNFEKFEDHYPYQDGALIIKNSWGKNWWGGENGYFYISMDSFRFDPKVAFTDVVDPIYNYTYQYDPLGYVQHINFDTTGKPNECSYANVFTAENPKGTIDNLKAVGFYLPWDDFGTCDYNYAITVYTDLTDANNPESGTPSPTYFGTPLGGWYKYGGYYTQDISFPIPLNGGSKFSVVIKNSRKLPWDPEAKPICGYFLESRLLSETENASAKWGESFQLTTAGWQDLKTLYRGPNNEELNNNACIKAFTDGNFDHDWKLKEALDDPTLNVSSDNGYNLNWTRVIDVNQNDAAQSGWINTGERCHMEATIDVVNLWGKNVSFFWAVSSDPGNSLKLYIDQDPNKRMSEWTAYKSISENTGNIPSNWQQEIIHLTPGSHKLEWSYEKTVTPTATSTAADCGWVDGFFGDVMLAVVTPNGGEGWLQGTNQLITWDSVDNFGNLRIQLLKDDLLIGLIAEVPANPKMYIWEVGRWQGGLVAPGPGYKIRILTAGGMSITAHLQPIK